MDEASIDIWIKFVLKSETTSSLQLIPIGFLSNINNSPSELDLRHDLVHESIIRGPISRDPLGSDKV